MSSPQQAPEIFDRTLLRQRRNRAAAGFHAHDFLLARVAEDMSERLCVITRNFIRVLDLGSHTGFAKRIEAGPQKIGPVTSTDLSASMLREAQGACVVADEEHLPFADKSFDLVLSALSLHWANDLPGALIQIRRALVPDGLFMGAMLGGETLTELRQAMNQAEIECEGGLSPRISPFADLRDLGALMQRAGFALPVVDSDRVTVTYKNPLALMRELRGMGETNAVSERRRIPLKRTTLMRAAEIYAEKFALPDGRVTATFEILMCAGWSPHESQQKPLKPGSATTRLAEALGTTEQGTGEKPPC
ncbi:MAG: methyltransferase domain-containing protein [Pseudomonadota bacterium]